MDFQPSLMGLRKPIKEITRLHSQEDERAVLEEGRWRIPLSVYNQFLGYLFRQSGTHVEEIPRAQLNIASMGRAVKERGYPSPEELIDRGIPVGLANALAPYQRGGVDFVLQREGKALIADEMGLGKTVQAIAAMACYSDEWPVLVLSPSTARYHWEAEFLNWLGAASDINCTKPPAQEDELSDIGLDDLDNLDNLIDVSCWGEEKKAEISEDTNAKRRLSEGGLPNAKKMRSPTMKLLDPSEVNVLTTSSDAILNTKTRVVIVSYGLITNLIKKNVLVPDQFKCIIVDESHMLKNKNSKRTKCLMPLLKTAARVIMLSGTPAMAKPEELFPQLNALGENSGWWNDENEFKAKYVKDKYSDPSFAELHTLLTSTVMIRRLKHDILKDMPSKLRENVHINVRDPILGQTIKEGLLTLRQGKGVLGKLSVLHQNLDSIENREQRSDIAAPNVQQSVTEGDGEKKSRKAILNHIFRLTGTAKIPALIDMLKRWLANPTNGKLCIFAHHINVLNALVQLGGLSNAPGSTTKYIRIDGSTNPKFRQEQITSFQNDPTVKIAILGLTAAGVGVTLTAASTIWFAELFWTPALMIQAEDR
jgi:SWI/SNF-related matrix-associated actin-dependent regulator 1 of chromatin subfamily A